MGVIYIGDRRTGKTHLAMELANPKTKYVKVCNQSYEQLEVMLRDEDGGTKATNADRSVYQNYFEILYTVQAILENTYLPFERLFASRKYSLSCHIQPRHSSYPKILRIS